MEAPVAPTDRPEITSRIWKLSWLTPWRCRGIFLVLLLIGSLSSWRFLTHNCPVDLSGDEAQYWTWSRHLDWSYYSKGPAIAYIIRASCSLLGDTMPAVRLPALVLGAGTSLCAYWLARKLFCSDRVALGAFLLGALTPLYVAGQVVMTIDSPLFFCWALATCLAVAAIFDDRKWAWPAAGFVVGLGFLDKYSMYLWLPSCLFFLLLDGPSRRWLKTRWPWVMTTIALCMSAPVIVWNAQHDWVSLMHVATQTGTNETGDLSRGNPLRFIGSQIGIINPMVFVLMAGAVVYGIVSRADPNRRWMRFLLCIGVPFFLICLLDSLRTKVQANWAAPAYFTLLILTAYFVSTRLKDMRSWRPWRGWVYGAMMFGLVLWPLVHEVDFFYETAGWINRTFARLPRIKAMNFDPLYKLRGIADPLAANVSYDLQQLRPGSFVLCEDYQDAACLEFYLPGHPKAYVAGSYWTDPQVRRRLTQFDMWPDRRLDRPELLNQDAIYIGTMAYEPLRESFESVYPLPTIVVRREGMDIRSYTVWMCTGFKGMRRPDGKGPF